MGKTNSHISYAFVHRKNKSKYFPQQEDIYAVGITGIQLCLAKSSNEIEELGLVSISDPEVYEKKIDELLDNIRTKY